MDVYDGHNFEDEQNDPYCWLDDVCDEKGQWFQFAPREENDLGDCEDEAYA